MTVFEMIETQQKGIENTAPWMVGEQLKDICRADPACADIVAEDLQQQGMGLADCEKKIKAWADKQKRKGNCVCVPPNVAEKIIREFYGLPETGRSVPHLTLVAKQEPVKSEQVELDLSDLLGM